MLRAFIFMLFPLSFALSGFMVFFFFLSIASAKPKHSYLVRCTHEPVNHCLVRSTQVPRDVLCRVIGERAEVGADVDVIEVTDPETGEVTTECHYNQTKHQTRLAERQARIDASETFEGERETRRMARLARIKTACRTSTNELVKDICRELLYLARQTLEDANPTVSRALSSVQYLKRGELSCAGEKDCRQKLSDSVCEKAKAEFNDTSRQFLPIISQDFSEVYCAVSNKIL